MAVTAAVATVAQGYAGRQQGIYQNDISKYNQRRLDNEATATRNKGTEAENRQREATAQLQAKQRAQIAAQGTALDSGSAADIVEDTRILGEADALRIRSNFADQAAALTDQGELIRNQGKNAASVGKFNFGASLLKGAGSVAGAWYSSSSALNAGELAGANIADGVDVTKYSTFA